MLISDRRGPFKPPKWIWNELLRLIISVCEWMRRVSRRKNGEKYLGDADKELRELGMGPLDCVTTHRVIMALLIIFVLVILKILNISLRVLIPGKKSSIPILLTNTVCLFVCE